MLKVNLHFHTAEDATEKIQYTLKQGVEYARMKGYDVLALTCHRAFVCTPEHVANAKQKGILLIPGIEANIFDENGRSSHVVILNCDEKSASLRTFDDLRAYKQEHPDVFVLAPHPYYYGNFSLQENLEKHIDLFDAIEHSWFYSIYFDRNVRAEIVAKQYVKPFISTSDTHFISGLDSDYALVDTDDTTASGVFKAIREKKFRNVTEPRNVARLAIQFGGFIAMRTMRKLAARFAKR